MMPNNQLSSDEQEVVRVARAIYFEKLNRALVALGGEALPDSPNEKPSGTLWDDAVAAARAALPAMSRTAPPSDEQEGER